jgi:GAF domain-containing protein
MAMPELLPARLARSCAAVLPVDGAGLSLVQGDFRVPLGASDDQASLAERLQFTQGEGPCLDAARQQRIQVADVKQLHRRWPLYTQELLEHTAYRAIIAMPLMISDGTRGALDMFLTEPGAMDAVSLVDAATVMDQIVEALTVARALGDSIVSPAPADDELPAWLLGPTAQDRQITWIANGMLMTRYNITAPDALALLRAYAYGHDTDTDTTAAELVNGNLDINQLQV